MAGQKTFRSAFNGFNRDDVVNYIKYLNEQHTAEVNQLTSEAEFLRSKLEDGLNLPKEAAADVDVSGLREELQAVTEEKQRLEAELQAALGELENLRAQQADGRNVASEELEAYRRAERVERVARERSEQVYHQVNGVLADATVKVDEASTTIGTLSDQVLHQLNQLQEAVCGSKQALQEAAQTMYTLRPEKEA